MVKSNLNGNVYQKLEYINNLIRKNESKKKSLLRKKIFFWKPFLNVLKDCKEIKRKEKKSQTILKNWLKNKENAEKKLTILDIIKI